jgi:hypothetical protein
MANKPGQRRQLPALLQIILLLFWGAISLLMLLSAVIGLGCVVLGVVSLFGDLSGVLEMQLGGEPVRTAGQKVLFTAVGAGLALAGIGFWWLYRRDHVRGALLVYAVLMVLCLVIGWRTGRADIISVGR